MPNPFRRMLRHTINAKISIKALVLIAIIVLLVRKDEGYQSLTLEGHRLYGDIPPMEPDVGKGCSLPVLPDHTCPFLRKQEHKGRIVYTKLLADACKKGVADVCFVPFSMKHRKQLVPISLPALLKRLASVGGAECFSGPLRKGDLVMSRVTGIHGEPLYSVYHKSCEGRYRDLSRLEILSVLYHYTNLANIGGGKLQRGLFLHGDSMIQNFGEVFWSVLRGQEHHVQNRGLNIFIMYRDHDETFELPDKFADENVSLPVHLQCVLEEFHAGSLLNPTITSSDCQVHVQDIIMTVLVKRDRYPEDPSYGFLRRTSRAAVSYHSFNYWWDQENPPAQSIEDLTRSYLKFEEFQYESHFSDPTVNATPSDTLNIPPLLFLYGTSPKREGAEYAPWRIDEALVSRRNTFLRTLRWQRHPRARVYSLFGDNHNQSSNIPVRRYLIDFAVIKEFLGDVAHTTDRTHFTCSDEKFIVRDGFFCVDAMNYVQIQWISHIVASELLFSVLPKGESP